MFVCEENNWLLEKCVFTHYVTLSHIRVHGDFVVCFKSVKYNLYVNILCKGFLVFFFYFTQKISTEWTETGRMIDPMVTRKHMYAKLPEGRWKNFPWINVFRFCTRNMSVSLIEQAEIYGPSPLVQNMLISNLFPHAWDGRYRSIVGLSGRRGNL